MKIFDSTYVKEYLKQVADNENHLNAEERTQLLNILEYLNDLFGGTLGYWDNEPVNLDINPGSKLFNSKYYLVPRINKETFHRDLKCLVKIVLSTPVQ